MDTLLEHKLDIVLRVSFHISDEIEVIYSSHQIILECIKLFIDSLFKFLYSNIQVNMIETICVIDLIAVDELCEGLLFFLHQQDISFIYKLKLKAN